MYFGPSRPAIVPPDVLNSADDSNPASVSSMTASSKASVLDFDELMAALNPPAPVWSTDTALMTSPSIRGTSSVGKSSGSFVPEVTVPSSVSTVNSSSS